MSPRFTRYPGYRFSLSPPWHCSACLPHLDAGEREAIALALGQNDPLLLLDDAAGRSEAKTLGIRFTGTLGVLVKGKQSGLIAAVRPYLEQLEKMGFYLHDNVRQLVLRLAEES